MIYQLAAALLLTAHTAFAQPSPGLLIERRVAEALLLSVGDTVLARAASNDADARAFVVEGLFERAADPSRISRNAYEVRFHLPDLESMLPVHDRVDRFSVVVKPGASAERAARWIEGLAFGTSVYSSDELAGEASTTFLVISRFHRAIGLVTVLASGIFLLCVMVIRVDERRRDIGVLRLIGVSRRNIFRSVVGEAVTIAVLGSVVGVLLGIGITAVVNLHYARIYDTTLRFALVTPQTLLMAAALGVVLGIGAGALAALRVLRMPVERLGER